MLNVKEEFLIQKQEMPCAEGNILQTVDIVKLREILMPKTNPTPLTELFTIRQAAELLGRAEYSLWWHAKHNLIPKPIQKGRNILLSRQNLESLVEDGHIRLRGGESKVELLARIRKAVAT
jgi:hypothetical protein